MKISQNTLDILKNFSEINTNILIKPGKVLSTISTMRNIFAKADISEEFSAEFGIYDLNEFLGVVTSIHKPEIELKDKFLTISSNGTKAKYFYASKETLVAPQKDVIMPETDVTFTLTESNLTQLLKMAAVIKTPDLALVGTNGGDIVLKICDKKNATSNNFEIKVGEGTTTDYTFYFKVENLKLFAGDYDVSVSSKSISHFKHKKLPIEYWIALEPDSSISK